MQHDISSPKLLFDTLSATKTNILLFYVTDDVVNDACANVPLTVPAIPGTMSIHQVLCTKHGQRKFRDVSCFCSSDKVTCTCYEVKDFSFSHVYAGNGSVEPASSEKILPHKKVSNQIQPLVSGHLLQSWMQAWLANSVSSNMMAKPFQAEYCRLNQMMMML